MGKVTFSHEFDMYQRVFHITPDSLPGIIIDIRYSILFGVTYLVTFGFANEGWCFEHELTTEKAIV